MAITILFFIGTSIIVVMTLYLVRLYSALAQQKRAVLQAQQQRRQRIEESIQIIAQAMLTGECNLSEGVIRLKKLLDVLGKTTLSAYPAMNELYQVVADMPTHEARKQLSKQVRMRQDLSRESAEVKLETQIKLELPQLLEAIK
ncbi:hypothetical protein CEP45_03630 [Mergibacter septicus]|uniref:DUF2489 domain-containing protein n=1 Tax=Mergibacter septicus TaxID=221402 RepID=UPI001C77676E|nr:DUF2489 domain-containing protein [Mergibacter septicus]QDJ12993.1 hypothetical protein CEP45_03630 [Mergibacter septicus]